MTVTMTPPSSWTLPEQIRQRLGQKSAGKQRAMIADEHLLLVLHKAPRGDALRRQSVFFWRDPQGQWFFSGWGDGLDMLWKHMEEFNTVAAEFLQAFHNAKTAQDYFTILDDMTSLHHAAKNLHATLQSAREGIPQDRNIIDLRDEAYQIERTLDLLYTDTKNALDFLIARQAEAQAQLSMQSLQTAHRLNVLAAIFFPLTAIASIFSMNMNSGLQDSPAWVFWIIFASGLLLGLALRGWVLKKS